jgi:hypothetical protein
MKRLTKRTAVAVATAAACTLAAPAHASLTFQGVTFTTSYAGNVLTVEIDAANPTGDWSTATTIGALEVKGIGTFSGVTFTGPGAAAGWSVVPNELNASGCVGGAQLGRNACASGAHVPLSDNMIFTYTFTGQPNLTDPTIKVAFYNGDNPDKVGSLLSMDVPAVPEPGEYAMLGGGLLLLGSLLTRKRVR